MGATRAPQAHVSRGPARGEDRHGFLPVRRERQEEVIDSLEQLRTDTAKAATWTTVAGLAQLGSVAFGLAFFPQAYVLLVAIGYGLLLPAIATLHVRHAALRRSGAVLATAAGIAVVVISIDAAVNTGLIVSAVVLSGVWWWTIGKMWAATGVVPRWLGLPTMLLAALFLALAIGSVFGIDIEGQWPTDRIVFGLWTLALAFALWRTR